MSAKKKSIKKSGRAGTGRSALGKGVEALLGGGFGGSPSPPAAPRAGEAPESSRDFPEDERVISVPLEKVRPNPDQPRKHFDETALEELASSIRNQGVLQPLIAEEDKAGFFIIVSGERRYRASLLAGLETVPVLKKTLSLEKKLEISLVENIQREDLDPLEEALAYKRMMQVLSLKQEEVARRLGKSRSAVANSLRLLRLSETMREALGRGRISPGHGRALLSLNREDLREALFQEILSEELTVRDAEKRAASLKETGEESKGSIRKNDAILERDPDPRLIGMMPFERELSEESCREWSKRLSRRLRLPVRVFSEIPDAKGNRRGRIEIGSASEEECLALLKRLLRLS